MNEQIRKLVSQAIIDVDYIRDDDFTNEELSKMYIPDCFAEKFAELIVRECANIVNSLEQYEGQGDCSAAEYIKERFGVEE